MKTITLPGGSYIYGYNDNDQRVIMTDPSGRVTSLLNDGFGLPAGSVSPSSVQKAITKNAAGRPVDIKSVKRAPTGGHDTVLNWRRYEYDSIGRVTKTIDRLFKEPLIVPPTGDITGGVDLVTTTVYDDAAKKVTTTDPRGNQTVTELDDQGRTIRVITPAGTQEKEYFANGPLLRSRSNTTPATG